MADILQYRFFLHALAAAILTSVTCGVIGTYIVSRRMVFISGGISHASFGGVGIAYYAGISPLLGATVFAVASALAIEALSIRSRMRRDAWIGIMWSFGMAVGIIFVFRTPGYAPNLMTYLFGNILTVSGSDLLVMSAMTVVTLGLFIGFFKEILAISFDEDFSRSQGVPVVLLNFLFSALIALTVVISIRVVGIILVISLMTIPAVTANLLVRRFSSICTVAAGIGLAASLGGLISSYYFDLPSGATIILTLGMIFLLVRTGRWIGFRIRVRHRSGR